MAKQLVFDESARQLLLRGVEKIAKAVKANKQEPVIKTDDDDIEMLMLML